ncbi:MAG: molybdopterin-dependent oxidoreductase [Cyclobacteriaceae bacterium]|nr:molybdopterin-dependent oxidoreductase [Cyclobacteriaceae bacterium]MDH4297775.1 molybdopterin-dependent oxidoreductase [Cyclobacteriaceae bacterium]MDH5248566.1 molybdopterin-dependent oxidoreductase [Cyclobacteriaceae bacterium]
MKKRIQHQQLSPEQGEPVFTFRMDRRKFFKALGSGITVTFSVASSLGADLLGDLTDSKDAEDQISAWIHVGENGLVTVYTGKVEVGQNIRTSLAQIVAEEMDVHIDSVEMIMGDTNLTPYDRGTFGSRSIPFMGPQLRKAAASAREYFIDLAAEKWKTNRKAIRIENGTVFNDRNQQTIDIGKLVAGKKLIKPINNAVSTKPVEQWRIAGTSVPKKNGETFVTGKHKYVSDMKLPGMLYGKILRPPAYGATLTTVDASGARSIKDVTVVIEGNFVGVAAPTLRLASEALYAIKAEWKTTPQPSRSEIFSHLKAIAKPEDGHDKNATGNVREAFNHSALKIEQTFNIDYIAHAPLEPRAGIAQWNGEKLTVWVGTQRPFGVQQELADVFPIPKEDIRVIMPDTGSGYGGKHTGEAGIEAARLAREAKKPVKVVWSREEEFTWAYLRPAGVIEVKAGATNDGIVSAWEFHNYNSGSSGIETPYDVANKEIQFHPADSPLRQGSYRGLAATANVFARECVMNDLARAANMDPLAFRLKNLKETRMIDVLEAAAVKFGWATATPAPNHGIGIGCGDEKGSYVATCAEVAVDPDSGNVKVTRIVVAFECGAIINPNHLENQIVGSVIQGMGGALFEWIDFKDGKIVNPRFSSYRVPRFSDLPKVEAVMLNRKDIPSLGAGETPILGIAPAIRNAISHATGKNLNTLPLVPAGLNL